MQPLVGHHHITLCVGDAQEDFDFHTRVLGLKSVKKTLLYDGKVPIYHFYYGNDAGEPGTLVTTFPMRHTGLKGRKGSGQISTLMLAVPPGSLGFWKRRLEALGFDAIESEQFGERRLDFAHPCGIGYALVEAAGDRRPPHVHPEVGADVAIRGTHGIACTVRETAAMDEFVTAGWSARQALDATRATRYELGAGGSGTIIDVEEAPDLPQGSWTFAEGTIHHCAFGGSGLDDQMERKLHLEGMGFTDCSDVKDRGYFDSVYVRTPGGPLFEVTISKPEGFAIDEPADSIGAKLMISPQFELQREEILAVVGRVRY